MVDFIPRDYRSKMIRKAREKSAEEYKARVKENLACASSSFDANVLFIPPELIDIAEKAYAGVSDDDPEKSNSRS